MSKKSFKDSNPAMAFISKSKVDDRDKNETESTIEEETQIKDDVIGAQEVQEVQHEQDAQQTPEVQDQKSIKKAPKTQGRKGQKLPRINMAFDEENIEYLRLMSRLRGVSMTQYVNDLLDKDREANDDVIKKAEKLLDM